MGEDVVTRAHAKESGAFDRIFRAFLIAPAMLISHDPVKEGATVVLVICDKRLLKFDLCGAAPHLQTGPAFIVIDREWWPNSDQDLNAAILIKFKYYEIHTEIIGESPHTLRLKMQPLWNMEIRRVSRTIPQRRA